MQVIDSEKLTELKKHVPHGGFRRIAKELGKSPYYVSQVFAGKHWNEEVIGLAIEIIEAYRAKNKELEKKVDSIINSTDS